MRPQGTADELEARRRRAVKLLGEGWLVKDVAEALGVSRQSVSAWKKRAGSRGENAKALASKPQHVPERRLSKPQQTRLKRLLRAGPRKAGFETDLWTLARIAELVRRELGVSYHPSHLGRLLHALGFSCQKPERRSKEQDPEAVRAWREESWPAIKKGLKLAWFLSTNRASCCSRWCAVLGPRSAERPSSTSGTAAIGSASSQRSPCRCGRQNSSRIVSSVSIARSL